MGEMENWGKWGKWGEMRGNGEEWGEMGKNGGKWGIVGNCQKYIVGSLGKMCEIGRKREKNWRKVGQFGTNFPFFPVPFSHFSQPHVCFCVRQGQVPCSSTLCPDHPPCVLFPLTAGLPLMGSRCCANGPSGLRETPPT